MQPEHKVAVAAVVKRKLFIAIILLPFYSFLYGQILPKQELQVNFNGYFDSFDVNVIYPSISLTHNVSDNTSFTARYLVDMITAASIKSNNGKSGKFIEDDIVNNIIVLKKTEAALQSVDAVTAASGKGNGEEDEGISFDDVRNEFNLGITHLLGKGVVSLNGIYSVERDYASGTIAGTYQHYFAKNDASFQLGIVKSWDQISPTNKNWTKNKNVITISTGFSQVISKSLIIQFLASYTKNSGLLADVYQQVTLQDNLKVDPIHPNLRIRKAAALKLKFRISLSSSLEAGYRYYWDTWTINSNTVNITYMRYLSKKIILKLGLRNYSQSKAFFFKPFYTSSDKYRTVDIKLDSGNSMEYQLGFVFLKNEDLEYNFNLNIYTRNSSTPYWFNNKKNLFATNFNLGLRYKLK